MNRKLLTSMLQFVNKYQYLFHLWFSWIFEVKLHWKNKLFFQDNLSQKERKSFHLIDFLRQTNTISQDHRFTWVIFRHNLSPYQREIIPHDWFSQTACHHIRRTCSFWKDFHKPSHLFNYFSKYIQSVLQMEESDWQLFLWTLVIFKVSLSFTVAISFWGIFHIW